MEVSSSLIRSFLRCKRKYWLEYYRGLRSPEGDSKPQNVGIIVHKGLEALYSPDIEETPTQYVDALVGRMIEAAPAYRAQIEEDVKLAKIMLDEYVVWKDAQMIDAGLTVTATETKIKAPLGDSGHTLTGRLDMRGTRFGKRVIIDHKTVEHLDDFDAMAQIDFQFLTYDLIMFLEDQEDPADAVIINLARRVDSTHPKSKPPYFKRLEVRHNRDELRNHWKHVVAIANDMAELHRRLDAGESHQTVAPPNPLKACQWECKFKNICSMFDDGSNVEALIKLNFEEVGPGIEYGNR